MKTSFMVGILVFIGAYVLGRVVSDKAFASLSEEQKLTVMERFASLRSLQIFPPLVLIAGYLLMIWWLPSQKIVFYWTFLLLLVTYIISYNTLVFRRIKALDLPKRAFRMYLLGRLSQLVGLFVLLVALLSGRPSS